MEASSASERRDSRNDLLCEDLLQRGRGEVGA